MEKSKSAWDAGRPIVVENPEPKLNPFLYSREKVLDLFEANLPLPNETNLELDAFLPGCREPLAFVPLTENEKRIFSSSINSDGNRRQYYRGDVKVRPGRASNDRVEKKKEDDLWDMPIGHGTFGQDGIFGYEKSRSESERFQGQLDRRFDDSDRGLLLSSSYSPPAPKEIFSFGAGFNDLNRNDVPIPPFKFVPPKWMYKDPEGNFQGPFSSEQMHLWYKEGYFPPALPIKCVDDPTFIPLFQFMEKYGREAPFLESLAEQEYLERAYYNKQMMMLKQQQMQQQFVQPVGIQPKVPIGVGIQQQLAGLPIHEQNAIMTFLQQKRTPDSQQKDVGQDLTEKFQQNLIIDQPLEQNKNSKPPSAEIAPKPTIQKPDQSPKSQPQVANPQPLAEKPPEKKEKKERKKKEKSEKVVEKPESKGVKDTIDNSSNSQAATTENQSSAPMVWGSTETNIKKMTLKEIQLAEQMEADEKKNSQELQAQEAIIREAQRISQANSQANAPIIPSQATWGSQATGNVGKKSLAEIMEEEAKEKSKNASKNTIQQGYAKTVGSAKPIAPSNRPKPAAVMATGPILKPQLTLSSINTNPEEEGWSVVAGKSPASARANPPKQSAPPSTASTLHGASTAFVQWCKNALQAVQKDSTASLNVNELVGILLSVPIKESTTIKMICDDTLGGYTAIDPRKFADAFIKRRRADLSGGPAAWNASMESLFSSSSTSLPDLDKKDVWTSIPAKTEKEKDPEEFTAVTKKKKKGKK